MNQVVVDIGALQKLHSKEVLEHVDCVILDAHVVNELVGLLRASGSAAERLFTGNQLRELADALESAVDHG